MRRAFALGMAFSLMLPTPVRAAEAASGIPHAVGLAQGADITSTAAVVMEESTNTIVYAKIWISSFFPEVR